MHPVDPRIIQIVEHRWRAYNAIVESVDSPDAFIERVSQLLTAWSQEDAPLLCSPAQPEPSLQSDLIQSNLNAVRRSPNPRATLQRQQAMWEQVKAED